eukprot:4369665-Pyramimonas_sp.AAC.1
MGTAPCDYNTPPQYVPPLVLRLPEPPPPPVWPAVKDNKVCGSTVSIGKRIAFDSACASVVDTSTACIERSIGSQHKMASTVGYSSGVELDQKSRSCNATSS